MIPPECGFAVWLYERYKSADFSRSVVEDFIKDLSAAKKIETWNLDYIKLFNYIYAASPAHYSDVVGKVYEFYGHANGRTFLRWGDKNNFYLHHIDTIRAMYPTAKFIHIIRDGRDVACSYKNLKRKAIESKYAPQLPSAVTDIAIEWSANIKKIRSSFDRAGWENVYELRYEDLVSQPGNELKKVCVFLNEPYDANMEVYYTNNQLEHQEPVEFLQWKAKTVEKPTTSEIGKYRNELTLEEIKEFESISGSILGIYNYEIRSLCNFAGEEE